MPTAVGAMALLASLGAAADAAERLDCAAVNRGALAVDLATTPYVVREVTLKAGERLSFSFLGGSPTGSVALLAGTAAPRLLLAGGGGARTTYVAHRDGTFAFRFTRDAAAGGAFTVACTPTASTTAARRHPAPISPGRWDSLLALPEGQMADVEPSLEVPIPAPTNSPLAAALADPTTAAGKTGQKPAAGLDTHLKWEGKPPDATAADPTHAGDADPATTLGVKYKLQPQIMIGVLAQFDQSVDATPGAPRAPFRHPWMAGPTATVQLAPGLALDARAAWGAGEAAVVDPISGLPVSGISATERHSVDARLASTQSFGPWRFSPSVSVNYAEEKAAGSIAATHETLAARTTGVGRVDVTPEVAYRIEMPEAMYIEPKATVGSFWDIDGLSKLAPRGITHDDMRLKAGAGVTIGSSAGGTKLEVGGGVEGGGAVAPDVWSGRLQLSVPLK